MAIEGFLVGEQLARHKREEVVARYDSRERQHAATMHTTMSSGIQAEGNAITQNAVGLATKAFEGGTAAFSKL